VRVWAAKCKEWAATSLFSPKNDKCEAKGKRKVPPLKRLASLFKRVPPLLKRGAPPLGDLS
jgi:hypothetical protein